MRMAGDRIPSQPKPPRVKAPAPPKVAPPKVVPVRAHFRAAPTPRPPGQSLTQAPNIPVPPPQRATIFQRPMLQTPTQRLTQQARHGLAASVNQALRAERGYLANNYGTRNIPPPLKAPTGRYRPISDAAVRRTLSSPAAQDVLRSIQPFVPKEPTHHGGGFSLTPAAIVSDVGNELKGTGAIEKGLTSLGSMAAQGWERAIPGKVGKFIGNAAKDAYGIGATAVPSIYLPARALATGHPGQAGKMLAQPFEQFAKNPGRMIFEHPVAAALMLRGGEAAISRAAGAAGRSGLLGDALAREAATTERLPIALGGQALETRRYSKGLVENLAQKALDRRALAKRGTTVRVPVRDAQGKLQYTAKVPAAEPTPLQAVRMTGRRIDREYGSRVDITRQRRDQAARAFEQTRPPGQDAVALINEGVIKTGNQHRPLTPQTVREDLTNHLAQLKQAGGQLQHPADQVLNEENLARVQRLLGNEKFLANPAREIQSAAHYANALRETEGPRAQFGDFATAAAKRRIMLPFAVRELGLRFNHDTGRFELPTKVPVHVAQTVDRATEQLRSQLERARPYAHPVRIEQLESQLANATKTAAAAAMRTARANRNETTEIGLPVSDRWIEQKFVQAGGNPEHLAYVPAKQAFQRAGNWFGSHFRRPGAEAQRYTGESALPATYKRDFEQLRQTLARGVVRVGQHEAMNHLANVFGLKQSNGEFFDMRGAEREIQNQAAKGKRYVAVNVARQSAPDSLLESIHPGELTTTFREAEPGDSHIVLFPAEVSRRILSHQGVRPFANPAAAAFTRTTRAFRHTVLPLSPRFVPNYAIEAAFRMAMGSSFRPADIAATIRAGHQLEQRVRDLGPAGRSAVESLRGASGKMLYGSQRQLDVHNPDEGQLMQFMHQARQAGLGEGKVTGRIGPKGVFDAWDAYVRGIHTLAAKMEQSAYWYAIGKEGRDQARSFMGSYVNASKSARDAWHDVANGLLESNNIDRFAREADNLRGKYSNQSPAVRWLVTMFLPFLPWYMAAAKFLALLPVKHPVKTALLADATLGTQQQRAAYGLPPYARSSLPLGNGHYMDIEHYLPFDLLGGSGLGANLAGTVLPQGVDIIKNLEGTDAFGNKLPKGAHPGTVALNTAIEAFMPLVLKLRQLREEGGTPLATSNLLYPKTKPGTKGDFAAGLNKAMNPFRVRGRRAASSAQLGGSVWPVGAGAGGNRFLESQSSGGNRFLGQGQESGNRFLGQPASSENNRFLK